MTKVEFRHRLREAMEMNGMKQADLASKGFDKGQISAWLSGKYKPKQSNIDKLSQIFGVSEAWLMGFDVSKERFSSDDAEHFNAKVADFNERRNERIINMQLSDSELDMIQRLRQHQDEPESQSFYIDPESQMIAQEVFQNPELRMLFKASRDVKPESIRLAAEMLKQMKSTNPDG